MLLCNKEQNRMKKKFVYTLIVLCLFKISYAQNNTSAYSILGIGDIENSYLDRSTGMANTGLAMASNRFLYQANPASYSYLDDKFFNVEVAARFKSVFYSGTPVVNTSANNSTDLQFKKFVFAIKLKPRWGFSLGLLPYSTSNYSFYGQKSISGVNASVNAYYEGYGSTNQFYIANSYRISKHLSIGIQSSWLFGQLQQQETILPTGINDSALITNRNIFLGNLYFSYGLQYHTRLNKNWSLSLGATAALKTKLRANYNLQVQSGTTYIINNQHYKDDFMVLPQTYNGGIAAVLKDKFTFAIDYGFQNWNSLNYKGFSYALVNSNKISTGFEYSNKVKVRDLLYEKYFLQAGLYLNNSYMQIYGQQINDYGLSLGAGGSFTRAPWLSLQGAFQVGSRGTTSNGLVQENYTQFNITISFRDFWWVNLKHYD